MEEPKNIAVKILVDKLKVEQGTLASQEASIKTYKEFLKNHTAKKNEANKNIKELAAALKKLGHKEEVK